MTDLAYRVEYPEGYKPIEPIEANKIKVDQLRGRPFFAKGEDDMLFTASGGSQYALDHRIRMLADAMPARTLAAGKDVVGGFPKDLNIDMQNQFKTQKTTGIYWPMVRGKDIAWRHGDMREVAYSFIFRIFDKFVANGGLK